jgi:hypothetical protein
MTRPAIHEDLLQTLKLWRAGKEIRTLELGHTQRIEKRADETERIDVGHVHRNDQVRIHQWAFHIVEHCVKNSLPEAFEEFEVLCDFLEKNDMPGLVEKKELSGALSKEEIDGAESLAWKAMLLGWDRAISGHDKDAKYTNLKNPKTKKKARAARGQA